MDIQGGAVRNNAASAKHSGIRQQAARIAGAHMVSRAACARPLSGTKLPCCPASRLACSSCIAAASWLFRLARCAMRRDIAVAKVRIAASIRPSCSGLRQAMGRPQVVTMCRLSTHNAPSTRLLDRWRARGPRCWINRLARFIP